MRWTRNCADRAWLRADEFANGDVSDISESPTRGVTFSIDNATDAGPARFRAGSCRGDELRAIKRYLATRTDKLPWLFVSERGQPMTRQAVNYLGRQRRAPASRTCIPIRSGTPAASTWLTRARTCAPCRTTSATATLGILCTIPVFPGEGSRDCGNRSLTVRTCEPAHPAVLIGRPRGDAFLAVRTTQRTLFIGRRHPGASRFANGARGWTAKPRRVDLSNTAIATAAGRGCSLVVLSDFLWEATNDPEEHFDGFWSLRSHPGRKSAIG